MTTDQYLFLFAFAILVIGIVFIVYLLIKNNKSHDDCLEMRNAITQDFLSFQATMIKEFDALSDRTQDKLMQMEERMASNMIQTHRSNNEIFQSINERIIKIDETQKSISKLSEDVVSLQSILTDKRSRGTFGEIELYSILESAYGVNNELYAKQYHLSNGTIADAVITGGESLGLICIDSKFPLENYRRMIDNSYSQTDRDIFKKAFKNDVKKHIDDISGKYIIPGVTAEMAYMFIPAEAIYFEIYANMSELVDYSYKKKVYIVSPTTLMAYLTAIKSIYLGMRKDEKTKEIQILLGELAIEFDRFYERNTKLYKDFNNLLNDFELLNTSSKKISKKFYKINSGDLSDEN